MFSQLSPGFATGCLTGASNFPCSRWSYSSPLPPVLLPVFPFCKWLTPLTLLLSQKPRGRLLLSLPTATSPSQGLGKSHEFTFSILSLFAILISLLSSLTWIRATASPYIRLACYANTSSHNIMILKTLQWFVFTLRIKFRCLNVAYEMSHGQTLFHLLSPTGLLPNPLLSRLPHSVSSCRAPGFFLPPLALQTDCFFYWQHSCG